MRRKPWLILGMLAALLPPIALLSLSLGASFLPLGDLWRAVFQGDVASPAYVILLHIRLPRLLGALMSGICLAGAGYILQKILNNPLAAPSVIGVNSGAGLLALCAMLFLPGSPSAVPAGAFLGALLAALMVYLISTLAGSSKASIILSGVALSALLNACMDALVTFFPDAALSRSSFSIGGFESLSLPQLGTVLPFMGAGLFLAFFFSRELSILSMGDESARSVGLRPGPYRLVFLGAAALLSASAVSLSGLIGFVGLIAPHIARLLLPRQPSFHLPLSLLCGGLLCAVCDLMARLLFAPYELPVSILLAFLGAPFFLSLLFHQKRREAA